MKENAAQLINQNFSQFHSNSLEKVNRNDSSIAHTYQVENYRFISFYEGINKFIEGMVVSSGGPLYLIEGTYEYQEDQNLLTLVYYNQQSYVYKIQKSQTGLLAECIDAYSHHDATDFIYTPNGQVWEWKKWDLQDEQ